MTCEKQSIESKVKNDCADDKKLLLIKNILT